MEYPPMLFLDAIYCVSQQPLLFYFYMYLGGCVSNHKKRNSYLQAVPLGIDT